jgi:hypothetical protein
MQNTAQLDAFDAQAGRMPIWRRNWPMSSRGGSRILAHANDALSHWRVFHC